MDRCVVAIDFGTSRTGYAYSLPGDERVHKALLESPYWKTKTDLLLEETGPTKSFVAFGKGAHETFVSAQNRSFLYFSQFKMAFWRDDSDSSIIRDEAKKQPIAATEVIRHSLQYLRGEVLKQLAKSKLDLKEKDILWVLTVPAIWDATAKILMRQGAEAAGIPPSQLILALEPEAASLCCRIAQNMDNPTLFAVGARYLVADCGGGTIDVCAHQVMENNEVKEIAPASGGPWGSTYIDNCWIKFLEKIFTPEALEVAQRTAPYLITHLRSVFESWKIQIDDSGYHSLTHFRCAFPPALLHVVGDPGKVLERNPKYTKGFIWERDRSDLMVPRKFVEAQIKTFADKVVKHVRQCFDNITPQCTAILLVGGFGNSNILFDGLENEFKDQKVKIIRPPDPTVAVLDGAVHFGRRPDSIRSRVVMNTIGVESYEEAAHHRAPWRRLPSPISSIFERTLAGKWISPRWQVVLTREEKAVPFIRTFLPLIKAGTSVEKDKSFETTITPVEDDQKGMIIGVYRRNNGISLLDVLKRKQPLRHFLDELKEIRSLDRLLDLLNWRCRSLERCELLGELHVPLEDKKDRGVKVSIEAGGTTIQVTATNCENGKTYALMLNPQADSKAPRGSDSKVQDRGGRPITLSRSPPEPSIHWPATVMILVVVIAVIVGILMT